MPVYFVPNEGQIDGPAAFYVQGKDKTVYFTPEGVTFALNYDIQPWNRESVRPRAQALRPDSGRASSGGPASQRNAAVTEARTWAVKTDFVSARKSVRPEGSGATGTKISYFKGRP